MKIRVLIQTVVLAGSLMATGIFAQSKSSSSITPQAAFEKLKSLSGEWNGAMGERDKGPAITVLYKTTANSSAVVETLFPGSEHEMITVYHLDGDHLVLTHYCAVGNQPRMELTKKSTANELDFDFIGGTNLKPKKDMHMHSARIRFEGDDAIVAEWDSYENGKKVDTKKFFVRRKN